MKKKIGKKKEEELDFEFGDLEEDDAYDESDLPLEEIDWEKVTELQKRIDDLPEEGDDRKVAAYQLQEELRGEG